MNSRKRNLTKLYSLKDDVTEWNSLSPNVKILCKEVCQKFMQDNFEIAPSIKKIHQITVPEIVTSFNNTLQEKHGIRLKPLASWALFEQLIPEVFPGQDKRSLTVQNHKRAKTQKYGCLT